MPNPALVSESSADMTDTTTIPAATAHLPEPECADVHARELPHADSTNSSSNLEPPTELILPPNVARPTTTNTDEMNTITNATPQASSAGQSRGPASPLTVDVTAPVHDTVSMTSIHAMETARREKLAQVESARLSAMEEKAEEARKANKIDSVRTMESARQKQIAEAEATRLAEAERLARIAAESGKIHHVTNMESARHLRNVSREQSEREEAERQAAKIVGTPARKNSVDALEQARLEKFAQLEKDRIVQQTAAVEIARRNSLSRKTSSSSNSSPEELQAERRASDRAKEDEMKQRWANEVAMKKAHASDKLLENMAKRQEENRLEQEKIDAERKANVAKKAEAVAKFEEERKLKLMTPSQRVEYLAQKYRDEQEKIRKEQEEKERLEREEADRVRRLAEEVTAMQEKERIRVQQEQEQEAEVAAAAAAAADLLERTRRQDEVFRTEQALKQQQIEDQRIIEANKETTAKTAANTPDSTTRSLQQQQAVLERRGSLDSNVTPDEKGKDSSSAPPIPPRKSKSSNSPDPSVVSDNKSAAVTTEQQQPKKKRSSWFCCGSSEDEPQQQQQAVPQESRPVPVRT